MPLYILTNFPYICVAMHTCLLLVTESHCVAQVGAEHMVSSVVKTTLSLHLKAGTGDTLLVTPPLAVTVLPPPLPQCFLYRGRRGCDTDAPQSLIHSALASCGSRY